MSAKKSEYVIYTLRGLSPGIFGEAYAIATGTEAGLGEYRAEYFILTQRPSEALHVGNFTILGGRALPEELGTIDVSSAIDEAHRQAEIEIFSLMEKRAAELQRPDLAYLPFELQLRSGSLLSCWMRGRFTQQLVEIRETTKCPSLAFYLGLLQQNRPLAPH